MAVELPHFGFPFELGYVVEQDSAEHVMACENVIVRCPQGFRLDRPEFGIPYSLYRSGAFDLSGLEAALREFEPRSNVNASEYVEVADRAIRNIRVDVEA